MKISCFNDCATRLRVPLLLFRCVAKQPSPRQLLSPDMNLISVYYSTFFKIKVINKHLHFCVSEVRELSRRTETRRGSVLRY